MQIDELFAERPNFIKQKARRSKMKQGEKGTCKI